MTRSRTLLTLAILACGPFPPLAAAGAEAPQVITITARRFEYSPREVRLKQGETVILALKSLDVTHGLLCRKLKLDTDIPPGQETRVTVTPQEAGCFTAICNHFCGGGHGNMKMTFIVQ